MDEIIEVAHEPKFEHNRGGKIHQNDKDIGANGFIKYNTTFGIPVKDLQGNILDYKLYDGVIVVEKNKKGFSSFYDIVDIKKAIVL